MGDPPHDDRPDAPGDASDDPDRAAILARRKRFIALALTGLATAGCDKPNDDPASPKGKAAQEGKADDDDGIDYKACLKVGVEPEANASTGKPQPCLEVAAPPPVGEEDEDPLGSPQACLKVALPEDEPKEPTPQPCLRVAAPEDEPKKPEPAKPRPCLKIRPPEDEPKKPEPAKPRPCLKVAKPR